MPQIVITLAMVKKAQRILDLALDDEEYAKAHWRQVTMSEKCIRLFQIQDRYSGAEIDRRGQMPNTSKDIRELAAMTPGDLLKLQAKMVGKAG